MRCCSMPDVDRHGQCQTCFHKFEPLKSIFPPVQFELRREEDDSYRFRGYGYFGIHIPEIRGVIFAVADDSFSTTSFERPVDRVGNRLRAALRSLKVMFVSNFV